MPRTLIVEQSMKSHDKITLSYTAGDATNDHDFVNTGNEVLIVKGGAAPTGTVTVVSVADTNRRTGDITQAVSASTEYVLGPFPPNLFNVSGSEKVNVDLDDDTNIELRIVKLSSLK